MSPVKNIFFKAYYVVKNFYQGIKKENNPPLQADYFPFFRIGAPFKPPRCVVSVLPDAIVKTSFFSYFDVTFRIAETTFFMVLSSHPANHTNVCISARLNSTSPKISLSISIFRVSPS